MAVALLFRSLVDNNMILHLLLVADDYEVVPRHRAHALYFLVHFSADG